MKRLGIVPLVFFWIMLIAHAQAQSGSQILKACYTDWPPFSYEIDGIVSGFSIEIYEEIAKRSGFVLQYTQMPYARCKYEFGQGKYDVVVDGGPSVRSSLNLNAVDP